MRLDGNRKTRRRRIVAVLGVAIVLAVGGTAATFFVTNGGSTPRPDDHAVLGGEDGAVLGPHADIVRPARVIDVAVRPSTELRAFPGTVHPARSSKLAFRVGGPLIDLPVREGEEVAAGTLLARIDPRDFDLAVAELEARLDAAKAARRLAGLNHRRRAELVERGAVSVADLDRATAERDRTSAEVASLVEQLATARAALEDTRLLAPSDGRIARLHIDLHDYVMARAPVLTFHDTSGVDLIVNLPETIIPRLPDVLGIEVELSDRPGRRHAAEIREIASELAADTGAYRTALRIAGLDGAAPLAGLSGTAHVRFAGPAFGSESEILVPSSAVFAGTEGGDFVWVVAGEPPTVSARPVAVSGIADDSTRLAGGLEGNERIVAYGVHFLREGQRVRPMAWPRTAMAAGDDR